MGSSILTAVQSRAGLPGPRESSGQHCPSGEPWVSQKGAASVSLCSEGRRKHSSGPRASSWPRVIHHTPEVGACGHLHWVTLIILQGLTRSAPPDPRNLVLPSHSTPSFPAPALVFSSTKFSTCSRWPRVDGRGVHPRAGLAQHRGTHGHLGGETGWEERDGEGKTKSLQGAGRIKVRSVHGRQKGKGSTWQMDGKGLRSFSRSIVGGKDPVSPNDQVWRLGGSLPESTWRQDEGSVPGLLCGALAGAALAAVLTLHHQASPPSPPQRCHLLRSPCISFPQVPPEVEELWCSTQLRSLIPGG